MWTTGWRAGRSIALRFEPQAGTGGLKPYLHVRRDLWAKVTRALFFDLVELGEEREVEGRAMFGVVVAGRILCHGAGRSGEGLRVNEQMRAAATNASAGGAFSIARARG